MSAGKPANKASTWDNWLWLKPLERIAPAWAVRTKDLYITQAQITRTLIVAEPPPTVTPLWMMPLLEMGDVTISVQVVPFTTGETKRLLRMRRTQHLSDIRLREKQGRLNDPDEEAHFQSATQVETDVRSGVSRLFHTETTLTLRASSYVTLSDLERRIMEYLNRIGATTWPATMEHAAGFHDGSPLMRRMLRRSRVLDTTSLAYSFTFDTSNVGMPAGPIWGISLGSRRPLRYDAWNRALGVEAPHIAILAPTGTGKSVLAWTLICELLCGGGGTRGVPIQTIIVDPKADYSKGVAYFGGITVRWNVGDPNALTLNAMQIGVGVSYSETVQKLLGLIALATSTVQFPLSPSTTGIWEAAIRDTYRRYGISPDVPESWHQREDGAPRGPLDYPTLAQLYDTVNEGGAWDTPTLAQMLYPWAKGTYASLFARPTSADLLHSALISFDLESITHNEDAAGQLRAVASYLIGSWTWELARSSPGWRVLAIDEVETLLAAPESAQNVGNWLALGRSYGLQVIHMSQQYSGYTGTAQGRRAISNTPTKVFLQQAGGENITQIVKDFSLSPERETFLLGARKGVPGQWGSEALMVTPRGIEALEILPAPEVLNVLLHGTFLAPGERAVLEQAERVVRDTRAERQGREERDHARS